MEPGRGESHPGGTLFPFPRWVRVVFLSAAALTFVAVLLFLFGRSRDDRIDNPSFEIRGDASGPAFAGWTAGRHRGGATLAVGRIAHSGKMSCLLEGAGISVGQRHSLSPGRYRLTAYLRGLDIEGVAATELVFGDKHFDLGTHGTFGWTRLTYVAELAKRQDVTVAFSMTGAGRLWLDDVTLKRVADTLPVTPTATLSAEERPVVAPGVLGAGAVRCSECGYRNMPAWRHCYACGSPLRGLPGKPARVIASFENSNPFSGGTRVQKHATEGKAALRVDGSHAVMKDSQDWSDYDYLKADLFSEAKDPLELRVEVHDTATTGYWTRVNYTTVALPGRNTLVLPLRQLYVGEKSRPGRPLRLDALALLALGPKDTPAAPLFVDNVRLESDDSAEQVRFDGLEAFDFGTGASPVMEGFAPVTPTMTYSRGRGYGLKDSKIWRALDARQPDPLYQDFLCLESGGLVVDVPNGRYRVFVNIDNPSGFWGEYQVYRRRAVRAQGKEVVAETMDFESLKRKYFRFWNTEDLPSDDTFDKYQKAYFHERTFDVEVADGQLRVDFQGETWACSVSAVVVYPVAKADRGERFLRWVEGRRRFHFDNAFRRVIHRPTGDPVRPNAEELARGYTVFERDFMKDVYFNDTPFRRETGAPLAADAFAGEYAVLGLSVLPQRDLGRVAVQISDLSGPGGTIAANAVEVGYISHRIQRVTLDGAVYEVAPRLIIPSSTVEMPRGVTRTFWLLVRTPADAQPGKYSGNVSIMPQGGHIASVPVRFTVHRGNLDNADIPVGPWGHSITTPWYADDPASREYNREMSAKSLRKLREYGFSAFSGGLEIGYQGFSGGQPTLDFAAADALMSQAKTLGFLAVVAYGHGVVGFDAYQQDLRAMRSAGFHDYATFIRAVYSAIQRHAAAQRWPTVYWNIGDEPNGADLERAILNAKSYNLAFGRPPPFFTAATSFTGNDEEDPHFLLSKELDVANWQIHDERAVTLLRESGAEWAFYNGGSRWTFGDYLYKAVKQFGARFRLSWHFNKVAGDPYYALDCREDDYAWCNVAPDGQLVRSVEFERLRAGIDDYRRLLTLARLAKEKAGTPEAAAAEALIARRLASFELGQRDHDARFPSDDWTKFTHAVTDAIDALRR